MTASKICKVCGAAFAPSRQDYTVRCPDCRAGRTPRDDVKPCIVCDGAQVITEQRADGTKRTVPCWKCTP